MTRQNDSYNPLLCSYPDSDKINKLSEGAEAMYCRLIAKCDDRANYHGQIKRLLCKLYALRYENGTITARKINKYKTELVNAVLIKLYKIDGVEYIHIIDCKKSLRSDIKPKYKFPQPIADTGVLESVTDTEQVVTDSAHQSNPIQSNPIQSNPIQSKVFTPPTLEEIESYIQEKSYDVDPKKFFDYFSEGGWIDSRGNPVRNWKQKIITWSKKTGIANEPPKSKGSFIR